MFGFILTNKSNAACWLVTGIDNKVFKFKSFKSVLVISERLVTPQATTVVVAAIKPTGANVKIPARNFQFLDSLFCFLAWSFI